MSMQERVRSALDDYADAAPTGDQWPGVTRAIRVRRRRNAVLVATAAVAAAVLVVTTGSALVHRRTEPARPSVPVVRLDSLRTGTVPNARLLVTVDDGSLYAFSPDGRAVRLPSPRNSAPQPCSVSCTDLTSYGYAFAAADFGGNVALVQASGGRAVMPVHAPGWRRVTTDPFGQHVEAFVYDESTGKESVYLGDQRQPMELTTQGVELDGRWSADGSTLVLVSRRGTAASPALAVTAIPVRLVAGDYLGKHRTFERARLIPTDPAATSCCGGGWAPSPDGTHVIDTIDSLVVGGTPLQNVRPYALIDVRTGEHHTVLRRPVTDTLMSWTSNDRLVWWRAEPGTGLVEVRSTRTDGTDEQTLYRIQLLPGQRAFGSFANRLG